MSIKALKSLFAASAVALMALTAPAAHATLFSGSATFQGVTFIFTQTSATTLTFELKGTPSGDWAGVSYLSAFDLKDLGLDFTTTTAIANGPGATGLAGLNSQLSASNTACSASTGEKGTICFDLAPTGGGRRLAPCRSTSRTRSRSRRL